MSKNRLGTAIATGTFGLLIALVGGCASEDGDSPTPSAMGEIVIVADQESDEEIGLELRDYLSRNCGVWFGPVPTMNDQRGPRARKYVRRQYEAKSDVCANLEAIEVGNGRITGKSRIEGEDLEDVGLAFCGLIQAAGVADSTVGHEMLDASGESIRTCAGRES